MASRYHELTQLKEEEGNMMFEFADEVRRLTDIRVAGVGGAGGNAVDRMITAGLHGVEFLFGPLGRGLQRVGELADVRVDVRIAGKPLPRVAFDDRRGRRVRRQRARGPRDARNDAGSDRRALQEGSARDRPPCQCRGRAHVHEVRRDPGASDPARTRYVSLHQNRRLKGTR